MKRAVAPLALVAAAAVGACSISESGLLEAADGGADSGPDAIEPCATIDASCLGVLDPQWKPVAVTDAGCPAMFTPVTLYENPVLLDGGCACGACQVQGSYSCTAPIPISGGDNCGDNPIAWAEAGVCTPTQATQHLEAYSQKATGSVGCSAPANAGAGATADLVVTCVPGCGADFCGGASVCVMADGVVDCPPGFSLQAHAGTSVDPGCGSCPCQPDPPGDCTGTVTAFQQPGCSDAGVVHVWDVGTCNYFSEQYQSVYVTQTPPDASCTVTGPPEAGIATLVGEKTICCR
jgi:hypothetical protein